MIGEIREYFKQVVYEVEPDYRQHDEYFISDNIADSNLDCTYFLRIGDMSNARIDSNYSAQFAVTLELWKNGKDEVINRLDKAYCDAIEVMTKASDQTRLSQLTYIKSVLGNSISSEAIETNDNSGKFTIQFTVSVSYNIN